MTYAVLKLAHIIGAILIGAGLIGVWLSDMRSRKSRDLVQFSEAVRNIVVFYDGVVVPGAVLLLVSGTWMIVEFFGGRSRGCQRSDDCCSSSLPVVGAVMRG